MSTSSPSKKPIITDNSHLTRTVGTRPTPSTLDMQLSHHTHHRLCHLCLLARMMPCALELPMTAMHVAHDTYACREKNMHKHRVSTSSQTSHQTDTMHHPRSIHGPPRLGALSLHDCQSQPRPTPMLAATTPRPDMPSGVYSRHLKDE